MLKDTIIYTISAVIIQTQVTTNNEYNFKKLSVKYITANTFFITVLEFYPFSLGIELILIPIIVLLSICEVFTKNKIEYKKENLLFNIILTLTFISTIINCIIQIIHDPNSIFSRDFVNNLILPIILTLLVLPYYYVWSLYAIYQEFFVRLRHLCKQDGKSYKYRRNAIIRTCNINLKKIRIVNRTMRMAYCETNSDFVKKLDATIRNN